MAMAQTHQPLSPPLSPSPIPPQRPSQALVGFPPIRAFRINNTLANKDNNTTSDAEAIANKKNNHNDGSKNQYKRGCRNVGVGVTRFIKVNMDGDPIGRKVDLGAHRSYEMLALALEMMFHKPTTTGLSLSAPASKLLDGSSEFALTYEDKGGDWMLVGDVPWGMFLDMVKILRIMRTSDANGLGCPFSFRLQPSITDKAYTQLGIIKECPYNPCQR